VAEENVGGGCGTGYGRGCGEVEDVDERMGAEEPPNL